MFEGPEGLKRRLAAILARTSRTARALRGACAARLGMRERVDLTHSARPRATTGICADLPLHRDR
jgi:hypothetical protein